MSQGVNQHTANFIKKVLLKKKSSEKMSAEQNYEFTDMVITGLSQASKVTWTPLPQCVLKIVLKHQLSMDHPAQYGTRVYQEIEWQHCKVSLLLVIASFLPIVVMPIILPLAVFYIFTHLLSLLAFDIVGHLNFCQSGR